MIAVEKFDTASIAPAERLRYWNTLVDRTYGGTFVNAPSPDFAAQMWRWTVGDLAMIRPRSDPSFVGRKPDSRVTDERLVLHLHSRGNSRHAQGAREASLAAGDFAICSANEPYSLDLLKRHEFMVVEFPRAPLAARVPNLDDRLVRAVSGQPSGARIFHDFLLSLWRQGDQSAADPAWQSGVSNVFYDLVALAMRGGEAKPRPPADALRQRVVALIDARLGCPDLRTGSIADELGLSARTVQHVFAAMGTTPGGYILDRRLDRAAEMLTASPQASITDTAFALGFNDSAYFTLCFRARFGATPSAWRTRH